MPLRALIVDDEYPARQELRYLLDQLNDVEVVGEAAGATEALKLIYALEYDILFLDINLPGINGLELAAKLESMPRMPHIIFITAYDNYALDAFEVNAVDYILKPIDKLRLKKAIAKVLAIENKGKEVNISDKKTAGTSTDVNGTPALTDEPEDLMSGHIVAELGGRLLLVDVGAVCFIYTEGDETIIKSHGEKMLARFTLKELEARLNKNTFFRTHRSYIVNINKVKEIQPFFNGTYLLVMDDKEKSEVPVSRTQAKKLRKLLGIK